MYLRRWKWPVILLLAAMAALAGCGSDNAGEQAPSDGGGEPQVTQETVDRRPVVVLQGVDPTTLDPAFFSSTPQQSVMHHVFETLTDLDWETGEIVPKLARAWEQIDEVTWRFYLREDVTFANGEPFNAEAVKWNLDRLVDPDVGALDWFFVADADYADSVVVDEYTIDIITSQPSAVVADMLRYTYIVPPRYYSETPLEELAHKPVGSGPYRLVEWVRDDRIVLERREDYWGELPDIETIIFRPVPESSARIAELVTGNADLILNVGPDQTAIIDANDGVQVKGVQGGRVIYVMIDNSHEPFGDVRARQALNYAVNKEAILQSLFKGYGKPLAGIANSVWENTDLEPYPYDPDRALSLFAELGYVRDADGALRGPDGRQLHVTFDTPVGRYMKDVEVSQAVARDLRNIGIAVDIQTLEWSVRSQRQFAGELSPLSLGGLGGFFNAVGEMRWVNPAFHYSPRDGEIRWQSDAFVETYARMRAALDLDERKELADELQAMAFEGAPWIFLYKQYDFYGVSNRLADWEPRPDELVDLTRVRLRGN